MLKLIGLSTVLAVLAVADETNPNLGRQAFWKECVIRSRIQKSISESAVRRTDQSNTDDWPWTNPSTPQGDDRVANPNQAIVKVKGH